MKVILFSVLILVMGCSCSRKEQKPASSPSPNASDVALGDHRVEVSAQNSEWVLIPATNSFTGCDCSVAAELLSSEMAMDNWEVQVEHYIDHLRTNCDLVSDEFRDCYFRVCYTLYRVNADACVEFIKRYAEEIALKPDDLILVKRFLDLHGNKFTEEQLASLQEFQSE